MGENMFLSSDGNKTAFVTVETTGQETELATVTCISFKDGTETNRIEMDVKKDGIAACARKLLPFLGAYPLVMFNNTDFERLNVLYQQDGKVFHTQVALLADKFVEIFSDKKAVSLSYVAKELGCEETLKAVYESLEAFQQLEFLPRHMGGEREEIVLTEGQEVAEEVRTIVNKIASPKERKEKYLELVASDNTGMKRQYRKTGKIYNASEGFLDIENSITYDIKSEEDNIRYAKKEQRKKMVGVIGILAVTAVAIYFII